MVDGALTLLKRIVSIVQQALLPRFRDRAGIDPQLLPDLRRQFRGVPMLSVHHAGRAVPDEVDELVVIGMVRYGELLVHVSPLVPVRRPTAHGRLAEPSPLAVRRHYLLRHALTVSADEHARCADVPGLVLLDLQVQTAALQHPAALGDSAVHPGLQVTQGVDQLMGLAQIGRGEERHGETLGQRVLDPVRHHLEDAVGGREDVLRLSECGLGEEHVHLDRSGPLDAEPVPGEKSPV